MLIRLLTPKTLFIGESSTFNFNSKRVSKYAELEAAEEIKPENLSFDEWIGGVHHEWVVWQEVLRLALRESLAKGRQNHLSPEQGHPLRDQDLKAQGEECWEAELGRREHKADSEE